MENICFKSQTITRFKKKLANSLINRKYLILSAIFLQQIRNLISNEIFAKFRVVNQLSYDKLFRKLFLFDCRILNRIDSQFLQVREKEILILIDISLLAFLNRLEKSTPYNLSSEIILRAARYYSIIYILELVSSNVFVYRSKLRKELFLGHFINLCHYYLNIHVKLVDSSQKIYVCLLQSVFKVYTQKNLRYSRRDL